MIYKFCRSSLRSLSESLFKSFNLISAILSWTCSKAS
nr:MAG TPA: hypothetical protein [Caudoviricetes sp.]